MSLSIITVTITAVTFAILRDYLLYTYFIVQFIHATYFDCIYILYFLFVNNFNFILLCPQLAVKTNYMDTLIKLLLTYGNDESVL